MKRFWSLPPRHVLPMIMLVGLMTMTLRLGDLWQTVKDGHVFTAVPPVRAAAEPPKADAKAEAKPEAKAEAAKSEDKAADGAEPPKKAATPESDLYKLLAGRREQLDRRAQEMDERETLVLVAEQRIDQKIKEMGVLRKQLEALVGQAGAAQQQQLENLVKVYELMKPKDAGKIFETLEMPVLLGVVQKMKPARTAAVLAEMDPQKAKDITVALSKKDQLPEVK